MPEQAKPIEKTTTIGANGVLWSRSPVLRYSRSGTYEGRVFVEVWDNDAHTVVDSPSVITKALQALQSGKILVDTPEIHLTDEPATGGVPDQTFIGRVVIEVWSDGVFVGQSGINPDILIKAEHLLRSAQSNIF